MNWHAKSSRHFILPKSWQELQKGGQYAEQLKNYFSPWYERVLGYQFLNIGGLSGEIACDLPLRHQIVLLPEIEEKTAALLAKKELSLLLADLAELPFVQQSIDACLLANTLNFYADPHQLLREVHRVLTDDGYLFIALFNPCSGLLFKRKLNKANSPSLPFRHYCTFRVIDWLQLLNFDILEQRQLSAWNAHLSVIVAQKRTYPLTLNPQKVRLKTPEFLQPLEAFSSNQPILEESYE
ncbi:MAG: class I SAM-dependent methyltransferase [Lonepinella koalarum]|nr:class I SAM-dependent methyltransferase [Lonepinella koalarum]